MEDCRTFLPLNRSVRRNENESNNVKNFLNFFFKNFSKI